MKEFPLHTQLIRLTVTLAGIFLLFFIISEDTLSDPVDTLNLQLQWAYPLVVKDMKLVDFDHDGINEILVGFVSDSSRVGILDAVTQSWLWQSPAFNGTIYTITAGDRNNDGALDIVCGGQRSDTLTGYLEVFDGPTFDSVHAVSGFDQIVLSAMISARWPDSLPQILLGTSYYESSYSPDIWCNHSWLHGKLYSLNGQDLTIEDESWRGCVKKILVLDTNGDGHKKLILGLESRRAEWGQGCPDFVSMSCWIYFEPYGNLYLLGGTFQGYPHWTSFGALEVGSFSGGGYSSIIGSGNMNYWSLYKSKLACWNAHAGELEWSIEWSSAWPAVTDLAVCSFNSNATNAICVAYRNGLIEFRSGSDGNLQAVSPQSHSIKHLEFGNFDGDPWVEMCVASSDSLYVYKTELWPRNDPPMVSDIPNQTIAEGESFASINLDDYVTDPDDPDSVMVWSHWGEGGLLVDITNRVATITVPNPEWNGAKTIWFEACDPGGLCDSDEATLKVIAVNDTPVVSDFPNQTIAEGKSFTSISLDDYVTDPDDPDSVIIWIHWGETELLVGITDWVATITVPNPEWNGAETIWFKACDPGGLCDSNQSIFTVIAVNDTPVVSDIPNQTIVEGESFASISLNDYVTDPDDPDSVMVWSHWGEAGLLVDITDRVATITVPNPEWNGAETIWFKACDPGGLCDSNQAIFRVNDTPMVSDIPNQIIVEGESFASISLDDYVTDPDDPDSVIVWSHSGEAGLLVDITDRVTTITVPNPEWNGAETIWFKACDPGGLCDSDEATFTVFPDRFCLFQNYPNPFNPQTNIRFALPVACNVTITIYSILGEKVREFEKRYEAGTHTLMWDGKNSSGEEIASGVYLYKLSAGIYQDTKKMVLIR